MDTNTVMDLHASVCTTALVLPLNISMTMCLRLMTDPFNMLVNFILLVCCFTMHNAHTSIHSMDINSVMELHVSVYNAALMQFQKNTGQWCRPRLSRLLHIDQHPLLFSIDVSQCILPILPYIPWILIQTWNCMQVCAILQ